MCINLICFERWWGRKGKIKKLTDILFFIYSSSFSMTQVRREKEIAIIWESFWTFFCERILRIEIIWDSNAMRKVHFNSLTKWSGKFPRENFCNFIDVLQIEFHSVELSISGKLKHTFSTSNVVVKFFLFQAFSSTWG